MLLATPVFAGNTIKIGEIATVTGDFAAYGVAEVEAVKMAVKEINAKGGIMGKKVEVIMYDCRTRNEDMVNAARRLSQQDKVCAVIGPSGSGLCIAAAPVFNSSKVPHLGTLPTNPNVTKDEKGKVRPYNFRICFLDSYQGKMLAVFAAKDLKVKKAKLLYDVSSDYSHGLREFFTKNFTAYGGKVVADEGHRGEDVDFRAQLTKVKDSGADVLFLPGMGKDMALAIKQAQELGLKVTIIGGDGYAEFMNEIAGSAMKGTYWINHTYLGDPGMAPIFARYKKVYKDDCKEFVNGTMAYDATYWLVDAIKRAGKAEGPAIAKALETTKNLKLNHATLTMDPATHNPLNKAGIILKVGDDLKTSFYKKVEPK